MGNDRRRHDRFPRLLEVSFPWRGGRQAAVTTDVSLSGALVNCPEVPSKGGRMTLTYSPPAGGPDVCLIGDVTRVNDPSDVTVSPGFGMAWDKVWTPGPIQHLQVVLADLFQIQVRVKPAREGGAVWLAAPRGEPQDARRGATIRQDAEQLGLEEATSGAPPGFRPGTDVVCFVRRERLAATVTAVGPRFYSAVTTQPAPRVGDVVVCFHRVPSASDPLLVRIVAMVSVRDRGGANFSAHVVRVDLPLPAGVSAPRFDARQPVALASGSMG